MNQVSMISGRFDNARLYMNGLAVTWGGKRPGQSSLYLKEKAQAKRHYAIKKTKVQSACLAAWKAKQSQYMLFITFTFPFDINETDAAKIWNLTLKSLKKTYNVKNYVWIKEKQPKNNDRLHYHLLIDTGHIRIKNLQETYNNAIRHIVPGSHVSYNSVRLGNRPVVTTVKAIKGYLSKYISKSDNKFDQKASGWSQLELYKNLTSAQLSLLVSRYRVSVTILDVSEFHTLYILHDFAEKVMFKTG